MSEIKPKHKMNHLPARVFHRKKYSKGVFCVKVITYLIGAFLGLVTALFLADRSVRFTQKNVRHYVTVDKP